MKNYVKNLVLNYLKDHTREESITYLVDMWVDGLISHKLCECIMIEVFDIA